MPNPLNVATGRAILGAGAVAETGPTFLPSDIAGLTWWLRADTIGLSDGDAVGTWADESGNGSDVIQATTSKKPTFKTGIINGLPVVRYDGVDDLLVRAVSAWQVSDNAGMFFFLYQLTAAVQDDQVLYCSAEEAGGGLPFQFFTGYRNAADPNFRTQLRYGGAFIDGVLGSSTIGAGSPLIATYSSSGALWTIRKDAVAETLTVEIGSNAGRWLNAAGGRDNLVAGAFKSNVECCFLKGDLAEIIYYNAELSSADRDSVEGYLSTKWGVSI